MRARLAETERAAEMQREGHQAPQYVHEPQQPQQPSPEQIIANSGLPERAKTWLRQHSDFITDPSKNATLIALHGAGKRLELLREVLPDVRRLAVVANVGFAGAVQETAEVRQAAGKFRLEVVPAEIRRAEDLALAFDALKGRAEAVYVCGDALAQSHRVRISALALDARLPTLYSSREFVYAGGVLSYGPNFPDLFRRSAEFVDKILRGAKPGDIPVEQPTKFDLVINLKTAKSLGLEVPPTLLARADEVIE
jgi:putative ABC transport system substrate-binding protein